MPSVIVFVDGSCAQQEFVAAVRCRDVLEKWININYLTCFYYYNCKSFIKKKTLERCFVPGNSWVTWIACVWSSDAASGCTWRPSALKHQHFQQYSICNLIFETLIHTSFFLTQEYLLPGFRSTWTPISLSPPSSAFSLLSLCGLTQRDSIFYVLVY